MEQASALQDFIALIEVGMIAITVYLTVITGFLVAAYMAGPNLSKSQLLIVSVLFLVFALIFSIATFMLLNAAMNLQFDDGAVGEGFLGWIPYIILIGQLAGMFAAMKFMMDVRNKS